jgi:bacterioferritin-associated ferredoxin
LSNAKVSSPQVRFDVDFHFQEVKSNRRTLTMLVCHCRKVFDRDIRALCRETRSLSGVCRRSGAGTGCGGCVPLVRDIVISETGATQEPEPPSTGSGVAALCR